MNRVLERKVWKLTNPDESDTADDKSTSQNQRIESCESNVPGKLLAIVPSSFGEEIIWGSTSEDVPFGFRNPMGLDTTSVNPSAAAMVYSGEQISTSGAVRQKELLNMEGGYVFVDDVARILAIPEQDAEVLRRDGRLIGVATTRKGYAYPKWQFSGDKVLDGLPKILKILQKHEVDPWAQMIFFLRSSSCLDGVTPLVELRCGNIEKVERAARVYLDQGSI